MQSRDRVLSLLILILALAAPSSADTPYVLVPEGVTDFHLAPPKVFWHTASGCTFPTYSQLLFRTSRSGTGRDLLYLMDSPHRDGPVGFPVDS
jgi:hypothetical protein